MALMAVALGAVCFMVAYAATDWYRTGSGFIFSVIDKDPMAAARYAWADLRAFNLARVQYALVAGALSFFLPLVIAFFMRPRRTNDAHFMSMSDVARAGLTKRGGVFIGRAGGKLVEALTLPYRERRTGRRRLTRPKLRGGKYLWVDGDDVGGFVIGPPRSGKGASIIIPNALLWPHSLVVLDLRGETYEATAGYRFKMSKVVRFAPADRDGNTACYNPMDFISLDSAQRDIDLRNMAAALFPRPPASADPYWVNDARLLFTGIASFVMESPAIPNEKKTFATILGIMNGEEEPLIDFIGTLRGERKAQCSSFTLQTLLPYFDMSERQFSGIYAGVRTGMAPFLNERLMKATSKSTFDIRALKRERISLYLDFRREQVSSLGPLFNVLITQMMNFMSESLPRPNEHQVLVLLDEFQNLGKLENVTEMASTLGGNGISMWFFVQSLKAVDEIYRQEGRKSLINAARVQVFFGAQDADDLRYVSEQLGETSAEQKDVTRTKATLFDTYYTRSVHRKEVRRALMRPDEIRTLDKSKVIILPRGQLPILGTRNFYFADDKLREKALGPMPKNATGGEKPSKPAGSKEPSPADPIIVPPARLYHSGIAQSRLAPGTTFSAKAGRTPAPPIRRQNQASKNAESAAQPLPRSVVPSTPPPAKPVDFGALAAKAAASRVSSQKEALIAALLNQGKSFRSRSKDTEAFDNGMSVVEETLPDVVDE
ncbi:MAG: type IV secretory system conjugative DNA transfer family protein [Ochrobactrum anthropi]|uniref:Type IV secretory system conjugative DNA transfer family protein n=1 Tax=Brucella anthropi TaxID=529 RepID=A0A8I0TAQ1_BRUAN|nr:type IV secretory system conjugative DNA transfer family protein [Brucella anthropi]MBE0564028.1 type IV secretory system conjugative DNA transfer family protein [Brucella anthropi]